MHAGGCLSEVQRFLKFLVSYLDYVAENFEPHHDEPRSTVFIETNRRDQRQRASILMTELNTCHFQLN